jgi:hypothetical protein
MTVTEMWQGRNRGQRQAWLLETKACDVSQATDFRARDWTGLPLHIRDTLEKSTHPAGHSTCPTSPCTRCI